MLDIVLRAHNALLHASPGLRVAALLTKRFGPDAGR